MNDQRRIRCVVLLLSLAVAPATPAIQAAEPTSTTAALGTLAGTGEPGDPGNGGPARQIRLKDPFGLVRGPDGALWFCDYGAHRVLRLSPDDSLTSVAGTGQPGYSGDQGPGREATLNCPHEVRFGPDGNLYIADTSNHTVRKLDLKSGVISTVAGTGNAGYEGDGGPASRATFRGTISIQFSPSGDLYIVDIGNHVLRRMDRTTGTISTAAGVGRAGPTPDGAPIAGTPLNGPRSIDFDASGRLWLVTREGNQVLRLDFEQGSITPMAGTGRKGFTGDDGPARAASFSGPKGIAIAPDGSVYLADTENHAIRRIDPKDGTVRTVVGTGERGDGPDGEVRGAKLARPHGVAVDRDGAVLIGDSENHRIRRLSAGP